MGGHLLYSRLGPQGFTLDQTSPRPLWNLPGPLFLALGALAISFAGVFVKTSHIGPTASGFWRTLIGAAGFLVICLAWRQPVWQGAGYFLWAVFCGFLFALDLGFWHKSVLLVGPGLGTILAGFQVFFLAAIGALLFKERLGLRYALAVAMAFVGLYLLVGLGETRFGEGYYWGVFLGLVTALWYACYLLSLRRLQKDAGSREVLANLTVVSSSCAVFLALGAWMQGESLALSGPGAWWSVLGLGLVCQVGGWFLISTGLPATPASRAGLILLTQPILSFVWDILLFDRPTGMVESLGAVLALAGVYLGSRLQSK